MTAYLAARKVRSVLQDCVAGSVKMGQKAMAKLAKQVEVDVISLLKL